MISVVSNIRLFAFAICGFLVFATFPATAKQPQPDPNAVFPVEFATVYTQAGEFKFSVEIADDPAERSQGLMFRKTMKPSHGMLFNFKENTPVAMWMENTLISLDMVFIRPDGTVARIAENTTPLSRDIVSSGEPVSHVLELNAGMARLIGLKPGDRIDHSDFPAIEDTAKQE